MVFVLNASLDDHRIEYRKTDMMAVHRKVGLLKRLGAKDFIIHEYNEWGQCVASTPHN